MNKIFSIIFGATLAFSMASCMDSHDEPNTDNFLITAKQIGEPNTTIYGVKEKFKTPISTNNTFEQVKEDIIFEGVVVGNDVSGNLYQTIVIRHIGSTPEATDDQCIQVGIKHTILYPYFALGQRIRVNLKGLYVGNYSRTPKVGQPYYTSSGNLRLGPMLLEKVATNIQLIGKPNSEAPELTPRDFTTSEGEQWLRDSNNRNYLNSPMLAKVSGLIKEVQGSEKDNPATGALSGRKEPLPKIFAPEVLYDAGYAVDRTLLLKSNNSSITIRTSTQNDIAFLPIPADTHTYTGIMSYYSNWQMQMRSVNDIK
ncbi:hypothetical protein EII14_00835 [Alloprevotella sp. OH1205_COT-284]|uniref:DUF5689 domain-containing protein n=1 Tax=Alloprevotella sp. OH1205_COT-284 TaxID=2491043 RepID=UPI000F603C39|nr:DUF5689 domain-containing protein [Alloprevotella sp. OH1205_COT-284]RRD80881.1 hypothetical protein EII14_00835 [Alloprevotella sp. OH1205_COT-284]